LPFRFVEFTEIEEVIDMRVLVTGATGLIGGAVAHRLKEGGHEIVGLARSESSAAKLLDRGFVAEIGELADPVSLASAVRGADAVVHAASPNDQNAASLDEIATRAILEAQRGTGKRFIYTSGSLVYGSTGDTSATEDTPLNPVEMVRWRPRNMARRFMSVTVKIAGRPCTPTTWPISMRSRSSGHRRDPSSMARTVRRRGSSRSHAQRAS
jgi:NAD(P)-dependent dehydrogenase (short-subunit alcohol dehydrogenase family)